MKLLKHILLIPLVSLKHIMISLGLYPEKTLEERLNNILLEQRHRNFLDDIARIRNAGDYIPDYNAGPKHIDYHLVYKGVEVKWKTKTVSPPVKYNSIQEWKEALRFEAKKLSTHSNQLNILFSN